MSKELSPLEALNDLIDELECEHYGLSENEWVVERKQIIETALIENDEAQRELTNLKKALLKGDITNKWVNDYANQKNKKLKAFEIIKEKRVNVRCLMSGWKLGNYNSYKAHEKLTQEEYDLLKEVLL